MRDEHRAIGQRSRQGQLSEAPEFLSRELTLKPFTQPALLGRQALGRTGEPFLVVPPNLYGIQSPLDVQRQCGMCLPPHLITQIHDEIRLGTPNVRRHLLRTKAIPMHIGNYGD